MKHRTLAVLFTLALLAVPAMGASSILTPDGIRYAVEATPHRPQVEITRAEGEARARLVVPSTDDARGESQAQIAYDGINGLLFVVWARENTGNAEIRFATLNSEGRWSIPRNIAAGSGMYRGVQLVLTHSSNNATLMHVAWWSINGSIVDPEYALFGFENGVGVSADVANLHELANDVINGVRTSEYEDAGEAIHPPLTMARNGESVDMAFGSVGSTEITRLNVIPRRIGGNVRIWKPVGRTGSITPRANVVSSDSTPVQAFISNGRLALYTAGEDFNFAVLRTDNTWSPVRSVHLDEDNTAEELLRDLRQTVRDLGEQDQGLDEEEEEAATH